MSPLNPFAHLLNAGERQEVELEDRLTSLEDRYVRKVLTAYKLTKSMQSKLAAALPNELGRMFPLSYLAELRYPFLLGALVPPKGATASNIITRFLGTTRNFAASPWFPVFEDLQAAEPDGRCGVLMRFRDLAHDLILTTSSPGSLAKDEGRVVRRQGERVFILQSFDVWLQVTADDWEVPEHLLSDGGVGRG